MKKEINIILLLILWIVLAYSVGLNPEILSFLTNYISYEINDIAAVFVILMVILSIITAWGLIWSIIKSLKEYSKDF
ncbi:hypothetical protein [Methanococcus maripaludis]|uniref:Putative membrane protein YqjE n=1 Tax=Methanococcus maripaludis TaxID=39152 RepID=A0A7J9PXD7_METMI|nr:hypothetical protein [Methanococcus maripaludis]MBA2869680.1 putative membrane protein YqjE [Methanococcus maripaludis]